MRVRVHRDALTRSCSFLLTVATAASLGCRSRADEPHGATPPVPGGASASASAHADEPAHEELPRVVRLDPDVVRDAGVLTTKVVREVLSPTLTLPGDIAANPDKSARISSPVPGRIEQVRVAEGGVVKKGDVVAVLRVPDLGRVRGALVATAAKAKAARANEARLKGLYDDKLAPEQTYFDARAEAEALSAESRALSDQLAALGAGASGGAPFLLGLRAPISGVVVQRDAVVGQPVPSEHVLAHLADLREVWFLARVFEKDLSRLRVGVPAEVELNAYPKERFDGVVDYVGQQIDPVARTVTARIRVANPGGVLRLGLFGMARIAIAEEPKRSAVLVVPRTALVEVAGKTVVFVRHADGDYELHDVVLGEAAPGKVEVVSGLREGEEVVSAGVFTLKSVVLKGTMADGDLSVAILSAIVRWSLQNRAAVLLATILFTLVGIRAATALPIDAVPDITNVQVQVITSAPALSPVEVEQYVSVPVERAMAGLPRTTEVRSVSKYGLSVVTVVFRDGTDVYFARQLVSERIREAQDAVPAQYGKPVMGPISSGLGEIFQFTVKNDRLTLMQLEELLDWQIAPALRAVPGIVEVNSFGGEDRQYQIVLDPKRLLAAGVSIAQVVEALRKSNANAGGGYIEHNREHFVIGTEGLVKNLDDVSRVVIGATPQGVPITIQTVGEVRFGPRLRRGAASENGKGEVVVGVALMLLGENSRTVTDAVKARLASLRPSLPEGTRIEAFYDRSVLVDRTIKTVAKNLAEGALLVIVVLFVLLGDLRAGLVVAIVIPLSLLFAIVVMNAFGLAGNLMSLGAIDFGLMVDGAVIIVENAVRRLGAARAQRGGDLSSEERVATVESATLEVRAASVFGEAIIAIVYLPILALTGIEGKLFRPMATTVLLCLSGAFVLSLTVVPVLTSYLVRPAVGSHETWILRQAHAIYVRCFRGARSRPWLPVGLAVVALAATVALASRVGAEFVPQLDEGDLLVEARRLPGVALSESVATDLRAQRALLGIPEVKRVVSKTGAPEIATDPMGVEQSDIYLSLADRAAWRPGLTKEALAKELSEVLEHKVPEIAGGVSQPIQMRTNELVAGVRSDVAVLLYGPSLDELRVLGDKTAEVLRTIPGAVDVRVEQVAGLRYLRVIPDRAKLARYGLTVEDVNQVTETLAVGHATGEVLEGERRFGMVVRTAHGFDGDLAPLLQLPLRSVSGQLVPLGDVAELKFTTGPAQVSREAQSRRLTVELNVRGRDMLSVVEDAQRAVTREVPVPVGYRAEWGGQFEHYVEAKRRLYVVVPLALALIGFLLWMAFRSSKTAALIFLNVPFAVVGGVVALAARGIPFSISAGVGFIALFGVAVLNGLVLVSFARQLEEQGISPPDAIVEAAGLRLRPVLMTALVAALGFLPMALSTAPGAEVQRPLATVVIGGLVTATLLTLFVLPIVYAWLGKSPRSDAPSPAAPAPEEVSVSHDRDHDHDHARPGPGAANRAFAIGVGSDVVFVGIEAGLRRCRVKKRISPMNKHRSRIATAFAVGAILCARTAEGAPLTLPDALAEATASAADLAAARSRVAVARAGFASADKLVSTNPTLSASYGTGAPFGDGDRSWSLGVSQAIELGGQQGLRRDVVASEVAEGTADLARVRNEVLGAVVVAFYGLDTARRAAAVEGEIADLYEKLHGVARINAERGVGTKLDVLSLEVEVARLRAEQASATGLAASLLAELNGLLGRAGGTIEPVAEGAPAVPALDADALVAQAFERRPELAALRARQRAFRAESKLASREAWLAPTVGVGLQHERMAFGAEGFRLAPGGVPGLLGVDERRTALVFSVSIPVPLFDARAGAVARASAGADLAHAEERAQRRKIEAEVRAAAALAQAASDAFALQEKARPAALEAASGYREAYEKRQIGIGELLLAQERLLRARLLHLNARGALLRTSALLDRATGAWAVR